MTFAMARAANTRTGKVVLMADHRISMTKAIAYFEQVRPTIKQGAD